MKEKIPAAASFGDKLALPRDEDMIDFDFGGRMGMRSIYRYMPETVTDVKAMRNNVSALIFVFDANDTSRMDEIRDEISQIVKQKTFRSGPILLLARKSDAADAKTLEQLKQHLQLTAFPKSRQWLLVGTNSSDTEGNSIDGGLSWLSNLLSNIPMSQLETKVDFLSSTVVATKPPNKWSLFKSPTVADQA